MAETKTLALPCFEGRHADCDGTNLWFGGECECDCHKAVIKPDHEHKPAKYPAHTDNKHNICRVCKHWLEEGEGRSNDYLAMNVMPKEIQDEYADTVQQPICHFCMDNPDGFHTEFMRIFQKAEYKAKLNKMLQNLT